METIVNKYHKAKWWHHKGSRIVCDLCPRKCNIGAGQNGFCYLRYNDSGILRTMGYGRISGIGLDPVEKKPLYHVYPKKKILSIGTSGCNMGCYYCQNWDISKAKDENVITHKMNTQSIVNKAAELKQNSNNIGIAFTYNEPTIFAEWVIDIAYRARTADLITVMVTNGYISRRAVQDIYPLINAANIDLKSFSEKFYYKLTLSHIRPVLDSILWIKKENTWIELTTMLIPGYNDGENEIKELSKWILNYCGENTPLHFSMFHPEYRMQHISRTPFDTLKHAFNIAKETGLKFVYTGNTYDQFTGSTYCRKCGKMLIRRNQYDVEFKGLEYNECKYCGYKLPGIFNIRQTGNRVH